MKQILPYFLHFLTISEYICIKEQNSLRQTGRIFVTNYIFPQKCPCNQYFKIVCVFSSHRLIWNLEHIFMFLERVKNFQLSDTLHQAIWDKLRYCITCESNHKTALLHLKAEQDTFLKKYCKKVVSKNCQNFLEFFMHNGSSHQSRKISDILQ